MAPVVRTTRLAVVIVAIAAAALTVSAAYAASADISDTRAQQGASLPPIVKRILAEALIKEEEIKRRGPMRVSWPYSSFPLPLCLFDHGLCGAVNRDGSIAVAPRFDFVDTFHEGRALVRLGGLYGYVDTDGNVVVEPQYAIAGRYRLGLAEVDVGGKSALIDLQGRQVLEPRFVSAMAFTKDVFWVSDGVREYRAPPGGEEFLGLEFHFRGAQIGINGKWGLVDATGAWIRKPEFQSVAGFDANNGDLMWAKADAGWGLIKPDGAWFLEPTFQSIIGASQGNGRLIDDRAPVMLGRRAGYVDHTGRMVIAPQFNYAHHFVGGMPAPVQVGSLVGLIDRSGDREAGL
jgi:hypothetical protein